FGVPIDLDRSGDVPGLVEQHVLVAFDDDESGITSMLSDPFGADQSRSIRILGELRAGIGRDRSAHAFLLKHSGCAELVGTTSVPHSIFPTQDLPRKVLSAEMNASGFSECTQCPEPLTVSRVARGNRVHICGRSSRLT